MNHTSDTSEHPKWTLPHCALLAIVGCAALLEYFTGSTLVVGNNTSVGLLIATVFDATFEPS
jgi:hypothetical protein